MEVRGASRWRWVWRGPDMKGERRDRKTMWGILVECNRKVEVRQVVKNRPVYEV